MGGRVASNNEEPEGDDATPPFSSFPSNFQVWDSRYGPPHEAFSTFRETICNTFMPWTPEVIGSPFEGRVESVSFESGVVARVRTTPIIAVKTRQNIANSVGECIHCNFILSGELKVDQDGRTNIARPGDLVLYHSFTPVTVTLKPDERFDNLTFMIHKSVISKLESINIPDHDDKFHNRLVSRDKIIQPLANCFELITKNLHSFSHDELSALFNACVALLSMSAESFDSVSKPLEASRRKDMLREVIKVINKNISNPHLSPGLVAKKLNVSSRYIHKLFAHSGTTFSAYLTAERLEHIKSELIAFSRHPVPVSLLAFQWGFNDLSTFNRAFRARFGCAPSRFRVYPEPLSILEHAPQAIVTEK
jgi:AraC family transcriptional regulator, positive regulator of tynA and feaB